MKSKAKKPERRGKHPPHWRELPIRRIGVGSLHIIKVLEGGQPKFLQI
jgi:hypothetical protein